MSLQNFFRKSYVSILALLMSFSIVGQENQAVFEEIIVTAEKRSESLQDISQAVTVLTGEDLDNRQISTFVDISAIAPGVNVAKNEGFLIAISLSAARSTRLLSFIYMLTF